MASAVLGVAGLAWPSGAAAAAALSVPVPSPQCRLLTVHTVGRRSGIGAISAAAMHTAGRQRPQRAQQSTDHTHANIGS